MIGPYEFNSITVGDARELAKALPENSIHSIVTSPPYWGLRDYGVDGQIGLEETPEEYIQTMVELFRELRRALREDGTCWVVLGDTYSTGTTAGRPDYSSNGKVGANRPEAQNSVGRNGNPFDLPPKNLCMIPARVALALQADGWYLRSDIIWSKPNPMPESVTDRPTKAHEYIFLLTKSARYWYDAEAVREANIKPVDNSKRSSYKNGQTGGYNIDTGEWISKGDAGLPLNPAGRNRRTVWEVATAPFKEAHFAVFPPKLIEPCILAGCPSKVCAECGAPWERVEKIEREKDPNRHTGRAAVGNNDRQDGDWPRMITHTTTTGHRPTCSCNGDTTKGVVLDPFIGSGTTGYVAIENGRDWLGFELNEEYKAMALKRIAAARQPIPGLEPDGETNGRQAEQKELILLT